MTAKVAIVGYGYVGRGMGRIFPDAVVHDPLWYDPVRKSASKEDVNGCDLAIVCVPTPPKGSAEQRVDDGQDEFLEADTSIVEEVVAWIETPLILIKSTVPPGTTDRLREKYGKRICFSPEYMGEGGYYIPPHYPDPADPMQHSFMVLGGEDADCDEIYDIFIRRMGPAKTYFKCRAIEAELVKYMENTWIATKVTFCNTWFDICKTHGASYNTVREGWLLDPRVERMHTAVFKGKRGFDGKCLPKDLHGIVASMEARGGRADLLRSVWQANQGMRGEWIRADVPGAPGFKHVAYGFRVERCPSCGMNAAYIGSMPAPKEWVCNVCSDKGRVAPEAE